MNSSWYVLHLFVDQERFLSKYPTLPMSVRSLVRELLYFRKPDRGMYERETGGIFVGYVFVDVEEKDLRVFNRAIRQAGLGEILGLAEGLIKPLSSDEMSHIMEMMRSTKGARFAIGDKVQIKSGPYEGMSGVVSNIVGQTVSVRVQLRRTVSYAEISMDNLSEAA